MFSKLWKAPSNAVKPESFEFEISRETREPLQFNGRLEFESIGCDVGTYRFGDQFHRLALHRDIDVEPVKELERRVLACYDRQLMELMSHLETINDGRANN